jgi:hypothetical protein
VGRNNQVLGALARLVEKSLVVGAALASAITPPALQLGRGCA